MIDVKLDKGIVREYVCDGSQLSWRTDPWLPRLAIVVVMIPNLEMVIP